MSDDRMTFHKLQQELQKALSAIESSTKAGLKTNQILEDKTFPKARSLLARCEEFVNTQSPELAPTVRVLQHFACSGGTLVSKCIAALPNVYLLSEAHPTTNLHMSSDKVKFLPNDVTSMARYANIPNVNQLALELFKNNIEATSRHLTQLGGRLVLREHTHSDYCVGENVRSGSSVIDSLQNDFLVLRLATVRDPIDAYLSLTKNKWVHFTPDTFEEYCKRFLMFTDSLSDEQIVRYEDFVAEPVLQMRLIARKLDLPFDNSFIDTFSIFRVSGDSGRSGHKIEPRPRKVLSKEFHIEIENSESYKVIAKKFGYNINGVVND